MIAGRRVLGALALAALVAATACGGDSSGDAAVTTRPSRPEPFDGAVTTTTAAPAATGSLVAQALGAGVQVFATAAEDQPTAELDSPTENGAPLVFLVEQRLGDWLQVLLPVRPNGSTGWIRAADVSLLSDPYRIEVALAAHTLTIFQDTAQIAQYPIAVGTADTPTPGGRYYIKELIQPPTPNGPYGVYVYGLSGFSNVLESFNGGDGVIGIHGTNDPSAIGTDVSHGCIRLTNEAITEMVGYLPLGTPVTINP
ncbi:MAG TPA: L,D-transpeptidase [Acidimicrobiales bacterium]|nr:L,D-transpeptidase [Acidimicrobiales bacterium]